MPPLFKLPLYIVLLIGGLIVPVLERVCVALEARAKETPETWDDVAAASFRTVIEFFKTPGMIEAKGK